MNVNDTKITLLDAIFVFLVVGAGMSPWPFLALLAGAGYLAVLAFVIDRRTPPEETK